MDISLTNQILQALEAIAIITNAQDVINNCFGPVESLLKYSSQELIGKSITELLFPEDRKVFFQNLKLTSLKKGFFEGKIALMGKDKSKTIYQLHLFKSQSGGWVYVLKDLAKESQREHKLKNHIKLICVGEIANLMVHHFRNSITSIGGFSKRALRVCLSNPKCQDYLGIIHRQVARLEKLMNVVETFVYLPTPQFRPFEFISLLKRVLRRWMKRKTDRRWRFHIDSNYRPLNQKIVADPFLLDMALDEVLKNACDFTKPGDRIEVSLTKVNNSKVLKEFIEVRVKDTGPGLEEGEIKKIFDLFYTKRPEDVGMGLKLTQKIMEIHGGYIKINSRIGQGTEVTLRIPADRRRFIRYKKLSDMPLPS